MFLQNLLTHTKKLIAQYAQAKNIKQTPTFILGLSGGPDSVFLLYILHNLVLSNHIRLVAAHLDHQWRKDSVHDATFCEQLCAQLSVPFVSTSMRELNPPSIKNRSKEAQARMARRFFFSQCLEKKNADGIILAHHAQDQQETFFLRLIRGCTLEGLCAMKEIDGHYLRPLLHTNKRDILDWLAQNNISFQHDPTNESSNFLRNRIRHTVIPALQACDTRFDKKFASSLAALKQEKQLITNIATQTFSDTFFYESNKLCGSISKLKRLAPILRNKLIIELLIKQKVSFHPSTGHLHEISNFLFNGIKSYHHVGQNWKICKKQDSFWIETQ
ncbi:MAG: tRNA lysidine(34) synthetase TilS [Epsilonproteobacteria bacterium]|nr:tRNA lysidine(34) synthetase TilS [Campylobacterota bacterium]